MELALAANDDLVIVNIFINFRLTEDLKICKEIESLRDFIWYN